MNLHLEWGEHKLKLRPSTCDRLTYKCEFCHKEIVTDTIGIPTRIIPRNCPEANKTEETITAEKADEEADRARQMEVFQSIVEERLRQNEKWQRTADWHANAFVKLAVLTEELGEVSRCLLEGYKDGKTDILHLDVELIQVAAVAVAWIEHIRKNNRT